MDHLVKALRDDREGVHPEATEDDEQVEDGEGLEEPVEDGAVPPQAGQASPVHEDTDHAAQECQQGEDVLQEGGGREGGRGGGPSVVTGRGHAWLRFHWKGKTLIIIFDMSLKRVRLQLQF